ncbi:DEP domain-containing protein 1B-like isoform X2 [Dendronephthya gigantea]|uniref:DEP domain-containing protein 1B-like isoform X2 n=1 Tax=Dendronephthya gigantea TaxID=151771 RepID=UPI00106CBC77|nr:DEP domain-containing protein 1B-like isoform X2 [Dendronephthya gigantea]
MESGQNIALFAENEPFRATKMWNELVRNFKTGIRLKKKRWRMKYYEDCFSGSDALAWIHDFLKLNPNFNQNDVSRTQAKLLCQKLLQNNVFEDIVSQFKSIKPAFEENHLYTFENKASCDAKENPKYKVEIRSKKAASSLKRHSSFSDRFELTRKPLAERKALQNISKEENDKNNPKPTHLKPTGIRVKQSSRNETGGIILQDLGTDSANSKLSNKHSRKKHNGKSPSISGLTRKWRSEYDVTLMEIHEDCDEREGDTDGYDGKIANHNKSGAQQSMADKNEQTNVDSKNTMISSDNPPDKDEKSCNGEMHLPQADANEFWMTICLERLQQALNVKTLDGILDVSLLCWRNVMENITSDLRCVTDAVPKWLVSAMKCLIHWPQSVEARASDYLGFEKDVFKTVQEYFQLLPEPMIHPSFIEVFTKISGLITKCKLSGIRALQHALLLLKKEQRQQLQLLLRFMIKISNNHQLNLSSRLPTRELVIQSFVPIIFGGKESQNVHEILGIRITSFIMENYAEIFKVENQSTDVTFCFRVTKQDYDEQKQFGTQRFLEDLLENIVQNEEIGEKERKKKLKQFQKTYPEIYFSRYPADGLSLMSRQPIKLRRVIKPISRRHVKNFR